MTTMMAGANDIASHVLGWISIASWIIVYSPQIIENWKLKSGEGLSVSFVVIWLLGDVLNLAGAVIAGLIPTVIILAVYYTACDIILLFQIYYYRWKGTADETPFDDEYRVPGLEDSAALDGNDPTEATPLLALKDAELSESHGNWTNILAYCGGVLFVASFGVAAYLVDQRNGGNGDSTPDEDVVIEWRSQLFGWGSAALYLSSRVPQILKNRETHCAGLSLALFFFAIIGNVTYVASILAKSLAKRHLIANASWLAGSGGVIALDIVVLAQFIYYADARREAARKAAAAVSAGAITA